MRQIFVFMLVLIAVGAGVGRCADGPEFPLGVWYEGGVGAFRQDVIPEDPAEAAPMYARDFKDMAAHGVNAAVVPNTDSRHHRTLLGAAAASGVKLIVELDHEGGDLGAMIRGSVPYSDSGVASYLDTKLKPLLGHPALWRLQLIDEPQPGTYARYGKIASAVRKLGVEPFCCLIGSGPVRSFVSETNPSAVAFDCYPIAVKSVVGDRGAMQLFERVSLEANQAAGSVPVWAVIQAHSITGIHRFPTAEELRCMSYLALATGSKGLWWFLYGSQNWNPDGSSTMDGLVDRDRKASDRWVEIGRLTRALRPILPTLLGLKLADEAYSFQTSQTGHLLKDAQGRVYLFAVNLDTLSPQVVEMRVDRRASTFRDGVVTRVGDSSKIAAKTRGSEMIWQDRLAPGDGALYRL